MNKIVLYFRRSKKYYLENKVDYDHLFREGENNGSYKIRKSIKMWNLCFKMKYMDFRIKFRDIAKRTIDRNNFDDIILYNYESLDHLDPGTLIFPIDDDDWLSRHLATTIKNLEPPEVGFWWECLYKEVDGGSHRDKEHFIYKCPAPCGYCLKYPTKMDLLWNHQNNQKKWYTQVLTSSPLAVKISSMSGTGYMAMNDYPSLYIKRVKELTNKDLETIYDIPEEFSEEIVLYKELLREFLASVKV